MSIGIDFDNTIVCYDRVFHTMAVERGLIPRTLDAGKTKVKDYLQQNGLEEDWIALQGEVYGPGMKLALPFPGVLDFMTRCKQAGIPVNIISHRTRHPFRGPRYDLHRAADEWLDRHGFFDASRIGLSPAQVNLELTKERKLERIAKVGCSHFIDDLPEFLSLPDFPSEIERILFDPKGAFQATDRFRRIGSWTGIQYYIFAMAVLKV